jgi:hypothetical protein
MQDQHLVGAGLGGAKIELPAGVGGLNGFDQYAPYRGRAGFAARLTPPRPGQDERVTLQVREIVKMLEQIADLVDISIR